MRFKTVAVITAQSILDAFIIRSHACSLQPLLRFHVVQFCSTGSLLTCVFHSRRSAGLPYAKVTPWLWIGSTMFVLIGRLPPPPSSLPPEPSLPPRYHCGLPPGCTWGWRGLVYHGRSSIVPTCTLASQLGSTLCVTRAHFRLFKSCFLFFFFWGKALRPASLSLHLSVGMVVGACGDTAGDAANAVQRS